MFKEVTLVAISLTLLLIQGNEGCIREIMAALSSNDGSDSDENLLSLLLDPFGLFDEEEKGTEATTTASTTSTTTTTTPATTTTASTTPAPITTTASSAAANATTAGSTEKPKA
nr:uncharacterized protein DDB_G0290685-like isoform X2 [Halyomorpha halys]